MVTRSTLTKTRATDYQRVEPIPDPPREHDMRQPEAIHHAYEALRPHFPKNTLISGQGYLLLKAGDLGEFYPDILIAMGVRDPKAVMWRNGYVISEVGKPPDFVMEVASHSTGRRDYTVKRDGYARYGVGEYWRFDPSGGRWHDAPLAGDTLVDGAYVPVEIVSEPDGRHWGYSEVLGLELWWIEGDSGWEGGDLRFRDPVSGEFLPTHEETRAEAEAERARAEAERARAEAERARAEAERARAEAAEAELRRLRGE